MLAVFTVSNLDDGLVTGPGTQPGTLRQALFNANSTTAADSIEFQNGLTGVIRLSAGELTVTQPVSIVGPGANIITIDASDNDSTPGINDGNGSRVLNIDDGDLNARIAVEISGLTLTGGDVAGNGGGIRSREDVSLSHARVTGNVAVGTGARGGGIENYSGNLTIRHSTIAANSALGVGADGGGIHQSTILLGQQTLTVTDSTISNNVAEGDGGGIFSGNNLAEDQATVILSSTISGNSAGARGGGLFNFDGRAIIRHSTITANEAAPDQGSGIGSFGDTGTAATLQSTIVSGNIGTDIAVVSGDLHPFTSDAYNLIGAGNLFGVGNSQSALDNFTAPGDQTNVLNPGLAALADNGGATFTHEVLNGSPALDAGDPNAVANENGVPEFDQRGDPFGRIKDGDNDQQPRIDVGAYERDGSTVSADFDGNGRVSGNDFLTWQRAFETLSGAQRADGDANNDGAVNGDDLAVWEDMFGQVTPAEIAGQLAAVASDSNDMDEQFASATDSVFSADAVVIAIASANQNDAFNGIFQKDPNRPTSRGPGVLNAARAAATSKLESRPQFPVGAAIERLNAIRRVGPKLQHGVFDSLAVDQMLSEVEKSSGFLR